MSAHNNPSHENVLTEKVSQDTRGIEVTAVFQTDPARLYRALTTKEICSWWVRPGVFDTREWNGDPKEGGRWAAAGMGGGQPFRLEGEFIRVDPPRELSHTWHPKGAPGAPSVVSYNLMNCPEGVRLTLRHRGITNPEVCERTRAGWETSLAGLQEMISTEEA